MRNLTDEIRAFLRDEEGPAMIEYVLIAALIAVVCITFFQRVGTSLTVVLNKIDTALRNVVGT
jgi:pilus assembly protein Flp/PilA